MIQITLVSCLIYVDMYCMYSIVSTFVEGQFVWVAFHNPRSRRLWVWWWHLSWSNCPSTGVSNETSKHHHTHSAYTQTLQPHSY